MSITKTDTRTALPEVWMRLVDRRKLAKLMLIQGVSQRELAAAAGWKAHSYVTRLLSGDAKTLQVEPAARIAKHLGVGIDDLFLTEMTTNGGHDDSRPTRTKPKRRAA